MAVAAPSTASASSIERPPLSVAQLYNMSIGFLGLQFAWSIQMGQMSLLYQKLGASDTEFSIFWMAGPITGILVQPIIGTLSDRTWCKLGRRRPFFLIGAILTALTLFLMPNADRLMPSITGALILAALLLWVLDASINTSMGPYRALIPDIAPPKQHATANSYIGWAIGLGAVISFYMGGVDMYAWLGRTLGDSSGLFRTLHAIAPSNTHLLFYVGALTVLLAIIYTVISTKEYPPENLEEFRRKNAETAGFGGWVIGTWRSIIHMPKDMAKLCIVQFFTWAPFFCLFIFFSVYVSNNIYRPDLAPQDTFGMAWDQRADILKKGHDWEMRSEDGKTKFSVDAIDGTGAVIKTFKDIISINEQQDDLKKWKEAGKTYQLRATAGDQGKNKYVVRDKTIYDDGGRWASLCFMVWNIVCTLFALVLGPIADRFGKKLIHSLGLLSMVTAFSLFYFTTSPLLAMVGMGILGLGWATTVTMPYALLAGIVPKGSEGVLMGTFNIFICLPQLVCAATMGWVVDMVGGPQHRGIAFLVAAVSALLAIFFLQTVKEARGGKGAQA